MANIRGQISINEIRVYEVDSDPSGGSGLDANLGSIAILQSTSQIWRKWGTGVNNWTPMLYGAQYQYAESLAQSDNSSNVTYVSKLTLTTPSLPLGDYVATFQWLYFHSKNGRRVQISLLRNSVEYINIVEYVTIGSVADTNSFRRRFNQISGVQNIEFQFRNGTNQNTASVSNLTCEFWRVA